MSKVEKIFLDKVDLKNQSTKMPYIIVDNFPKLGLLTSLRLLEWVNENPEGVISLPTGKTTEYFIKWTEIILNRWRDKSIEKIRKDNGLIIDNKPNFRGLNFVQIDEFYPIDSNQHNSFYNYINKYYIDGFGIDPSKGLFIDCNSLPTIDQKPFIQIFPNHHVDLDLRFNEPTSKLEEDQKKTIMLVDEWCSKYEKTIIDKGGIGFFLGGIGPDGHIAFNISGSDHNSKTRLMRTNFETQAAAATDLGGIEISRNRLVITIGLSTITSNKDAAAIIIAAGESKAKVIQDALEKDQHINYPASVLHTLKGSRFYLTKGSASNLEDVTQYYFNNFPWTNETKQSAIVNLIQRLNKFGKRLSDKDLKNDSITNLIPNIGKDTVNTVLQSIKDKINKGISSIEGEVFYHTGPHHDDIMLGYLPYIIHLVRSPKNKHYFINMTSGFTSVSNLYLSKVLDKTLSLLELGQIQMINYPDFFKKGYLRKKDKDVYHYLDRIASNNKDGQERGLSHRIVRALVEINNMKSEKELVDKIKHIRKYLSECYDGEKNTNEVQQLKSMIREFEEELVWAHYGVQVKDVHHMRLGFYSGDIFTESPQRERDVEPILQQLKKLDPSIITVALDPEGSGPDTHYKVLQTIAEAVRLWGEEKDLSKVKFWGYRNVWYRFDCSEADIIVPVSLNSMAMLKDTFMNCYLSQKEASFPSYELDGPFCDLVQKIWVEQHQLMELVLGRDYWYQNDHPRLRATHGLLFIKEMNGTEFLNQARSLEKLIEEEIPI